MVSESRLRHRDLRNNVNITREFYTRDIVVARNKVKSSRKYGIDQKLVLKTKGPYRFMYKAKPSSYWLQRLNFVRV